MELYFSDYQMKGYRLMSKKEFVGFGFGPIQTGLMLLEAQESGNFERYTIAEIAEDLVDSVRRNKNRIVVNIAHMDRIEKKTLSNIEILNPRVESERTRLADAVSRADELATAIPSVAFYSAGGEGSITSLLARNLNPNKQQILYASENNNYAADILREEILRLTDKSRILNFQILDTVIGKMSGVIRDSSVIDRLSLEPMTPGSESAVLVEEFNRILVSRVHLPGYQRGIEVFEDKENLLPFEEAKLFGHNAIHAMLGYMAFQKGYPVMSDIAGDAELMGLGREAFLSESGSALLHKYGKTGEPLFTPDGYRAYAVDLLERMTNRFLNDEVARVCRDPQRKLAYNDRIFGTMRLALDAEITPNILAEGAVCGLKYILREKIDIGVSSLPAVLDRNSVRPMLEALWADAPRDKHRDTIIELVEHRIQ